MSRARAALVLLGLLALPALVGACGEEAPRVRNLLLVVVDTLRADHLGVYGHRRPTAPALAALAREGVRFEHAYAPSSWTKPSLASILTGLYPTGHGATRIDSVLPDEVTTLAEILEAEGYRTFGVVSGSFARAKYGLAQGFERYDESAVRGHGGLSTPQVTRLARAALREAAAEERPFFAFVHYFDPHYDYLRHPEVGFAPERAGRLEGGEGIHWLRHELRDPRPEEVAFLKALYDEEIRVTDRGLAGLLATLRRTGALDETLVVVTADHGEEFYERGWLGHTRTLHQEIVRVPLVVRAPGSAASAGHVVEGPASLASIPPTALGMLGVDASEGAEFAEPDLGAALRGGETPREAVLAEVSFRPHQPANTLKTAYQRALIGRRFKLIRDDLRETTHLYDLRGDPSEHEDLAGERPERRRRLAAELERRFAARAEGEAADTVALDAEERARLRALGYLAPAAEEGDAAETERPPAAGAGAP